MALLSCQLVHPAVLFVDCCLYLQGLTTSVQQHGAAGLSPQTHDHMCPEYYCVDPALPCCVNANLWLSTHVELFN